MKFLFFPESRFDIIISLLCAELARRMVKFTVKNIQEGQDGPVSLT